MTIPVVWVSYRKPEIISRGYMDQGMLERLFDRRLWWPVRGFTYEHFDGFEDLPEGQGAVVVVPAQHHAGHLGLLNADLAPLPWCLVVLTGDECALFPWRQLDHPNMLLWVMTPRPRLHTGAGRFLGEGWHVDTPDVLAAVPPDLPRDLAWFFAGQVTHERRRACVDALREIPHYPDQLLETPGFTQGMDRHQYLHRMARAKVVPCPSGPATPGSFRLYEALEAGCLPLADAATPDGWPGYWPFVFGEDPPFPVVEDWSDLPKLMAEAVAAWPGNANRAAAWWQGKKRQMAYDLETDVRALTGVDPSPAGPQDLITVLMPTSPTPNNPDTSIIEETIASIRDQPDLADAEIIVMIDGVRSEQHDRAPAYAEYVHRLLRLTNRWHNVVPLLAEEHLHQANLTRAALKLVRTPCVAFVEHDTPVDGPIPWAGMAAAIDSGEANIIRLHHETHVLDVHRHLMLDATPRDVAGVPLLRTVQWSQRPHLASTLFYQWMIDSYFGPASRTMIEDVMHGVVDYAWRENGQPGWDAFRLWMYAPDGNIQRTRHLDGRGSDPKFDMRFEYSGPTPDGAPRATSERERVG